MALAATASYDEAILEVEFVASSGTYTAICGITGFSVSRTNNVTETMVPDCDDATKAHEIKRSVASRSVTVSGTGVWARASNTAMMEWFYGERGPKLNVRIRNKNVEDNGASGDPYIEQGACILTGLSNERPGDKGEMTASIELQFDGTPTLTDVA